MDIRCHDVRIVERARFDEPHVGPSRKRGEERGSASDAEVTINRSPAVAPVIVHSGVTLHLQR